MAMPPPNVNPVFRGHGVIIIIIIIIKLSLLHVYIVFNRDHIT